MTPDAFLTLALSLPEASLGRHQGGADVRVAGSIFASPADRAGGTAVIKLTLEQREVLCAAEPNVFHPVEGRGAARGWTRIVVAKVDEATAASALWMAWRNVAPRRLATAYPTTPRV
jgi:hypothetical protein